METLREIRVSRGLTLKQVEAKTGIDHATLSRWETGKFLPRYELARRLADVYDLAVSRVYELARNARNGN